MKPKILLVEDNEYIRENTIELLGFYDFDIITASNGKEGLEIARKYTPDVILCDIKMPVMDGYHLLESIRSEKMLNKTRFIFFTASSEKQEIETALKMGADDYIIKPFTENDLIEKLEKFLTVFIFLS